MIVLTSKCIQELRALAGHWVGRVIPQRHARDSEPHSDSRGLSLDQIKAMSNRGLTHDNLDQEAPIRPVRFEARYLVA